MMVFNCRDNEGDHVGVAHTGAHVLLVVTEEEAQGDSAELLFSSRDARAVAELVREVARRDEEEAGDVAELDGFHVSRSERSGHVLVSVDHNDEGWRSVVLSNDDAERFATAVEKCATEAALFATRETVGQSHPVHQAVTARMTTRALAVAMASQALGQLRARVDVLAVAQWIAGEECDGTGCAA
jgi:hypothetical protein